MPIHGVTPYRELTGTTAGPDFRPDAYSLEYMTAETADLLSSGTVARRPKNQLAKPYYSKREA